MSISKIEAIRVPDRDKRYVVSNSCSKRLLIIVSRSRLADKLNTQDYADCIAKLQNKLTEHIINGGEYCCIPIDDNFNEIVDVTDAVERRLNKDVFNSDSIKNAKICRNLFPNITLLLKVLADKDFDEVEIIGIDLELSVTSIALFLKSYNIKQEIFINPEYCFYKEDFISDIWLNQLVEQGINIIEQTVL